MNIQKPLTYSIAGLLLLSLVGACGREPVTSSIPVAQDESAQVRVRLQDIQAAFNRGDLKTLMDDFTEDAVISGQGEPDVVGRDAIHRMYDEALSQVGMKVSFHTDEIHTAGDLAFERGTYQVEISDKASGEPIGLADNRHVHILRKGSDGKWRTWRMFVNSPRGGQPPPLPPPGG